MALGQTIGTVLGGLGGAAIGNPMLGAGVGGSIGGTIDSVAAGKKSDKLSADLKAEDSNITKFLSEINRDKLAYKTGSMSSFYADTIKEAGANAAQGALEISGGETGAALAATEGVSKGVSKGVNEMLAGLEKENQFKTNLAATLTNGIAQRKLELGLAKYSQAMADKAQNETNLNNSVTALIGTADYENVGGTPSARFAKISDWLNKISKGAVVPDVVSDSNFDLFG